MSDRGERGPQGDHGQAGDAGQIGPRGDSGPSGGEGVAGERGQAGDTGQRGQMGDTGVPGPRGAQGPRYSSWLTRNVVLAYGLLFLGVILSTLFSIHLNNQQVERIDLRAREACEAGNERSRLQMEDYDTTAHQYERLDLGRLLALSPEAAEDLRRLMRDNAERRISRLPFVNCRTGERLPPPPRLGDPRMAPGTTPSD